MSDFAEIKTKARRDIHAAFSLSGLYQDSTMLAGVELGIRWHDRFVTSVGDLSGSEYSSAYENIDKLVFNVEELAAKAVTVRRNGTVLFPGYDESIFVLDVREPTDGPIKVTWTVTRRGPDIVVAPGEMQNQVGRWRFFEDVDGALKIRAPDGQIIPFIGG